MLKERFQFSNYRSAYIVIKVVAWLTFLYGALATIDYYLPPRSVMYEIKSVEIENANKDGVNLQVIVRTDKGPIVIEPEALNYARKGMILVRIESPILKIPKKFELWSPSTRVYDWNASGMYVYNGFFAKILLLSIFVILYREPRYWMVALVFLNGIIALTFSGIPPQWIAWMLIGGSLLLFILLQIAEHKKERNS